MRNKDRRFTSTRITKAKHKIVNKREKINAVRGVILPAATGRLDLNAFARAQSLNNGTRATQNIHCILVGLGLG